MTIETAAIAIGNYGRNNLDGVQKIIREHVKVADCDDYMVGGVAREQEMLAEHVAYCEGRINDLLAHNNKLEERARAAEREVASLRDALLASARVGAEIARVMQSGRKAE